jgi:hypothetical protein
MVPIATGDTMNEEEARELAFAIIGGDFEELFAEHGIMGLIMELIEHDPPPK